MSLPGPAQARSLMHCYEPIQRTANTAAVAATSISVTAYLTLRLAVGAASARYFLEQIQPLRVGHSGLHLSPR